MGRAKMQIIADSLSSCPDIPDVALARFGLP